MPLFFIRTLVFGAAMTASALAPRTAWSLGSGSADAPVSAAIDSIPADPLLPEILGPGERMFWGEHGFMRFIGAYPLTEESREKEIRLRRTLLTAHEVGGFITLAAMIATATYGQLTLNGREDFGETHKSLAGVTIGSYFITAALSLMSPPPMIRRKEWNTISIHKGLALIHFTGMVMTPLLAKGIAGDGGDPERIDRDKARVHQVSGYITTATFAGAMLVVMF